MCVPGSYLYPIHLSGKFVLPPSLAAAFYLATARLLARDYEGCTRVVTTCFTDVPFSPEEA
jgi:hypothetical protein